MHKVIITEKTRQLLTRFSETGSLANMRELPGEKWEIELSDETMERVNRHALAGESFDATMERIVGTMGGLN